MSVIANCEERSRKQSLYICSNTEKLYFKFKPIDEVKPEITFFDFVTEQMLMRKSSVSLQYDRQCFYELEKLNKFRRNIKVSEITYRFLQEYEQYMRDTLGNKTNTVAKTFSKIRTFLNIALKTDLISKNPFEIYKIQHEPSNRQYLTLEELELLEKLYSGKLNNTLKNVLQYFLFACYTGLRYADMCDLTYENIKSDHIVLTMHKTKEQIIIPLIDKARKLMPVSYLKGQKVFKVVNSCVP